MQENLVIVESPAKAKTIEKFLGPDFMVRSSFGHIRDLSKKALGVNIEKGFLPDYEVSPDKVKLVNELKKIAKTSQVIWLASDEDREGEAIAWHLQETLQLPTEKTRRIVFHEITKDAILNAIKNPRSVDQNLVNAQQARRVLDRLVGFEMSPVLWKKVKSSLSAGRVQSVAVRLIVEREREIIQFLSESAFKTTADFIYLQTHFQADLNRRFAQPQEVLDFLQDCREAKFAIEGVERKPSKKSPAPPFTTSTLQQEASRKLGFSVSQTMTIAQKLYESGHITYMRTDSVNLSALALGSAKKMIETTYGPQYAKTRKYKTKNKGAQEAHEAIRPTYLDQAQVQGSAQEKKLYDLIWKRTIASQMEDAQLEKTEIEIGISTRSEKFIASGEVILFDGFLKVYIESSDEEPDENESRLLPQVSIGAHVENQKILVREKYALRPPRYTEASLVKKLEELGIGRPSTYAPTISTIINRGYVIKEDRPGSERPVQTWSMIDTVIDHKILTETFGTEKSKLFPSDLAFLVTDFLSEHFPKVMNYDFTAKVEEHFDQIAAGKLQWGKMMETFYSGFHAEVISAMDNSTQAISERVLGSDPKTGKVLKVRLGRFGPIAQIGESDDEPKYANLRSGQLLDTITFEEALKLFDLPRTLGTFEEEDVVIGIGKFGPYIRHKGKFTALKANTDAPESIELERAIELILAKRKADEEKIIKSFEGEKPIELLNGRYGPYIRCSGKNFKIPKGKKPEELTYEDCEQIMASQPTSTKNKK